MIAALPMYDRPETTGANDRLWGLIRDALGDGPADLTRNRDLWEIWQSPDLLLAQTCGFPFRARLHDHVTLVGTPVYDLPGTAPGNYFSVIVARANDARELAGLCAGTLAFNEPLSQSGWAAPYQHLKSLGLTPARVLQSGAHRASAQAVAAGQADFAALDAVSWAVMQDHDAFVSELRIVTRTVPTPGLPLITAKGTPPAALHTAVAQAIAALSDADRATLHLTGITQIPASAYLAQPIPPTPGE